MRVGYAGVRTLTTPGRHLVRGIAGQEDSTLLETIGHAHSGFPGQNALDLQRNFWHTERQAQEIFAAFRREVLRFLAPGRIVSEVKDPAITIINRGEQTMQIRAIDQADAELSIAYKLAQVG